MRLVNVTMLGTALVAAGMLAPATGEATATGQDEVAVKPDVVRPGQQVQISVPGCPAGRPRVTSEAFVRRAKGGTATVRPDVEPGTYAVVARCDGRRASGEFAVAGRLSWPTLLPTDR